MKKDEYLRNDDVSGLINFVAGVINGSIPIQFPYVFHSAKVPSGFSASFGLSGVAPTLKDLFDRYWWNRKSYEENAETLLRIQNSLRNSLKNSVPNAADVYKAVADIMDWGLHPKAAAANKAWAEAQGANLSNILLKGKAALESEDSAFDAFPGIRMNAGYTKVYALLCENSIIYDGRVGAALCWLVRLYLVRNGHKGQIPDTLAFLWSGGLSAQHRNPSGDGFVFEPLRNGMHGASEAWADVNMRANWILESARNQSDAEWCRCEDGLRKLEAALFMLGYALPAGQGIESVTKRTNRRERKHQSQEVPPGHLPFDEASGYFSYTELAAFMRGQKLPFMIIGGDNQSFDKHEKPHSLDYWLRARSSRPDVRQSTTKLVDDLLATGLFIRRNDVCPVSGRVCNSVGLTNAIGCESL
ncbi:hypothetical protein [Cupriavidus sp. AcVe19-6a]|uniref:hypothetical protein n=1 Tax=Cupriavidus sp. AcVe19-6a TaxID=2821358 RepID=UPI001AE4CF88|nr:hypothetical protein [Cupriavidus sp. AcVe19-6a]MBP0635929.1 hypothetical protein [Cupriavidus sp. AcVe19-6a]